MGSQPLTLADLWGVLGTGPWPWPGGGFQTLADVVVDSRLAQKDNLFVALPGEQTDGHLFVADAFTRGARAALIQRPVEGYVSIDVRRALAEIAAISLPACFLVSDTLQALQSLAAYWRQRHAQCRVVGITGSVGKTTTKELIAAVLSSRFRTLKSQGNYNNEIGLPLTMLRLDDETEWAVQEMGMYGLGEIAHLARIARPQVGVVTNVGPTHLERLGTIERIAEAKAELVQALPSDGVAILNGDDERVSAMASKAEAKRVFFYGMQPGNELWADDVHTYGLRGLRMQFHFQGQSVHARLPILGRHSAYGALAATAVGLAVGLTWDEIISGLQDGSARVRLLVVPGLRETTILDDTYNASPDSTQAALNLLSEMDGRRVAVLGDMLELGSYEEEGHRLVGGRAAEVASVLVTVGRLARLIAEGALAAGMVPSAVYSAANNDEAIALLNHVLAEGDFVLVKGSRGLAMEQIVASLARGD